MVSRGLPCDNCRSTWISTSVFCGERRESGAGCGPRTYSCCLVTEGLPIAAIEAMAEASRDRDRCRRIARAGVPVGRRHGRPGSQRRWPCSSHRGRQIAGTSSLASANGPLAAIRPTSHPIECPATTWRSTVPVSLKFPQLKQWRLRCSSSTSFCRIHPVRSFLHWRHTGLPTGLACPDWPSPDIAAREKSRPAHEYSVVGAGVLHRRSRPVAGGCRSLAGRSRGRAATVRTVPHDLPAGDLQRDVACSTSHRRRLRHRPDADTHAAGSGRLSFRLSRANVADRRQSHER